MIRPWMKFYPADWQADQALRSVGLEARCLWLECMCIMHRANPYGHLVVHGRPVTDTQLAVLAGASPDRVPALMAELATAGVSSRNRAGVLYSRRMTRDEKRSKDGATAKITGTKVPRSRRSQAIDKAPENITTLKVVGKVVAQPPSPQRPETREERECSLAGARHPRDVADLMLTLWSEECRGILKVPIKLTPERIRLCSLRWKDTFGGDPDIWRAHCQAILASPFLRGETSRAGWRADFDWALVPKNILKLQEGNYDAGSTRGSGHHRESDDEKHARALGILGREAIERDERESYRGASETPH